MSLSSYRSGLTIDRQQVEQIEAVISELYAALPASLLLLTDDTGDIVAVQGSDDSALIIPLASLVASELVTSQEIARLTTREDLPAIIFREGQKFNSFVLQSGETLVLYAQIERDIPLNWARVLLQQTSQKLAEIVQKQSSQEARENLQLNADEVDDALDFLMME